MFLSFKIIVELQVLSLSFKIIVELLVTVSFFLNHSGATDISLFLLKL